MALLAGTDGGKGALPYVIGAYIIGDAVVDNIASQEEKKAYKEGRRKLGRLKTKIPDLVGFSREYLNAENQPNFTVDFDTFAGSWVDYERDV